MICEILFKSKNVLSSYVKISNSYSGPVLLRHRPSSCCYGNCAAGSKHI